MHPSSASGSKTGTIPSPVIYAASAFIVIFLAFHQQSKVLRDAHTDEVHNWIKSEPALAAYKKNIYEIGCTSLIQCASLTATDPGTDSPEEVGALPSNAQLALSEASGRLRRKLILRLWLSEHHPHHELVVARLEECGIGSLEDLHQSCFEQLPKETTSPSPPKCDTWAQLQLALCHFFSASAKNELDEVNDLLWNKIVQEEKAPWGYGVIVVVSLVLSVVVGVVSMSHPALLLHHSSASKLGFLAYVTGKYLAPQNCKVEFDWTDPHIVGSTMTFVVKFFQRNGRAYPICSEDNLLVEITQGAHKVACSIELGGTHPSEANKAKVQFTVRRAGEYQLSVLIGTAHIRGSPFIKHFTPGPPDPQKTGFVHHCSTVVCTEGIPCHLFIEPRDKYNNPCPISPDMDPSDDYSADIIEVGTERPIPASFRWECHSQSSRIALILKLDREGCYQATVSYRGGGLKNGDFHIIVLNKADASLVQKNVGKKSHNIWYEARLVALNGEKLSKPKKVFCYISPKQMTIKEFLLKIIPKRLITFRLCPSTKFQFGGSNNQQDQLLIIDDGCQPPIELVSEERNVIAATYTQFLLKNIGGSETFKDKQEFFYHEVRKLHQKYFHDKLQLKIQRDKLLESSMKATKGFSTSDWCKNFEITFQGEQGLDWGGLRREWFELICSSLFDPENQLFSRFKCDKQGLVHPNPKRPPHLKLKHYEFAGKIVAKCLYESALGSAYRQLVKARFSRSFLAQLIGLRVHYKYFEQDDPDLYMTKIRFILENNVDDMELYFCEEEYSGSGQLLRVIELIPGGSRIQVTNQNKLQYLDALAQHRLANSVKDEVEHFLKGLNDLIPDNLLCIFDENELELLMCGTGQYSIADFKANHAVSGSSYEFRKVLDWFWTAVSNFTEEEMARLLQFTTGCSQLPPGGFQELNPKFHITAAPTFGNLPTAHTCFNQLCLPDYDSYEQFEQALRLAINEGSEGFGMI